MNDNIFKFWTWFFKGLNEKSGIRSLCNRWLFFQIVIGLFLTYALDVKLEDAGKTVLLPLAGILIGLTFAWAGNAQALFQSEEIEELALFREGGIVEYVYKFQMAILIILATVVAWGLASLGLFDRNWPMQNKEWQYNCIKLFLYTLSGITLRECWNIVLMVQWLLLAQNRIKKLKSNSIKSQKE